MYYFKAFSPENWINLVISLHKKIKLLLYVKEKNKILKKVFLKKKTNPKTT